MAIGTDKGENTFETSMKPIVRQVDAPVPWIMTYKEFYVYDQNVNKQNQLFRLLNVNNWIKNENILVS